ncbi:MAG: hypothetical protein LHW64_11075 [Candidatus Cloacimonetes bacterium]|nr:hypothetical protein [Candidatus Cloacimonadota bacterium]MDY0230635.1 hypothetical protein [Candidatus Cloacimonadaceae bacterium]
MKFIDKPISLYYDEIIATAKLLIFSLTVGVATLSIDLERGIVMLHEVSFKSFNQRDEVQAWIYVPRVKASGGGHCRIYGWLGLIDA